MEADAIEFRRFYDGQFAEMTLKDFHKRYPEWTILATKTGVHPGLKGFGAHMLTDWLEKPDFTSCPEFFCNDRRCNFNLRCYERFCQVLDDYDADQVK